MPTLAQKINQQLTQVDQTLIDTVQTYPSPVKSFVETIVRAGGKQLRSKIALAYAHSTHISPQAAIGIAAALETLHLATLIHDDLIDDGDLRRGVQPIHKAIGAKSTILFGDVLFGIAAQLVTTHGTNQMTQAFAQTVETIARAELEKSLAPAPAWDPQQAIQLAYTKTGILFELAAKITLLTPQTDSSSIQSAHTFGKQFGIAYQLIDDLIDLGQGTTNPNKSIAKDLHNHTITLPLIYHYQSLSSAQQQAFAHQLTTQQFSQIQTQLTQSTAIATTKAEINRRIKKAKAAIALLPFDSQSYLTQLIAQTQQLIQ